MAGKRSAARLLQEMATRATLLLSAAVYFFAKPIRRPSTPTATGQWLQVMTTTSTSLSLYSLREWLLPSVPGRALKTGAASPMLIFLLNLPAACAAGTAASEAPSTAAATMAVRNMRSSLGKRDRAGPHAGRGLGGAF